MSALATENVHHGFRTWIDYDRSWLARRQMTVSEFHASILSNLVAVALTLACPRLWILIKALIVWIYNKREGRRSGNQGAYSRLSPPDSTHPWPTEDGIDFEGQGGSPRETEHSIELEDDGSSPMLHRNVCGAGNADSELSAARRIIATTLSSLRAYRIQLPNVRGRHRYSWLNRLEDRLSHSRISQVWDNVLRQPFDVIASICLALLFVAIFVAESSGVIFSASVLTDSVALARSPNCSILTAYAPLSVTISLARSAALHRDQCYHGEHRANSCSFFYNQSITFTDVSDEPCPFEGDYCIPGPTNAYTMDTGHVEAKVLGINSAESLYFRRRATCSPIDTRKTDYFDETPLQNIPPSWINRGLRFGLRQSGLNSLGPVRTIENGTVTVLNIVSSQILYEFPREDPIFPASVPIEQPQGKKYYASKFRSGRILGCVDHREICKLDRGVWDCWESQADTHPPAQPRYDFKPQNASVSQYDKTELLLHIALSASTIFLNTVSGLEAKSHMTGLLVHGLPPDQWKVEVKRWFEASLAHMQVTVLDTVSPLAPNRSDKHSVMPANYRDICHMVKLRTVGWRNVNVWGVVGLLLLAIMIGLMSGRSKGGEGELWIVVSGREVVAASRTATQWLKRVWTQGADRKRLSAQATAA